MVLKGGVLENKRGEEKEIRSFFFFFRERRIGRAGGICCRKPQTLF
jgi:hypothetical protein